MISFDADVKLKVFCLKHKGFRSWPQLNPGKLGDLGLRRDTALRDG